MKVRTLQELAFAGETVETLETALREHCDSARKQPATKETCQEWSDRLEVLFLELCVARGWPYPVICKEDTR